MTTPTPTGIGGLRRSGPVVIARALTPDPLVARARSAFRLYGSTTSAARPMPEFLVIGAKKGGTTSVANWLAAHPQVMPMFPRWQSAKSPHYFDLNYWRGRSWYLSHFPSTPARRVHAWRTGSKAITGESSPYYLFHPAAPRRIAATVPGVKLIAVLREPVSRAYSNYWDSVARGEETLPTFEEAIDAEVSRMAGFSDSDLDEPKAYHHHHNHHTYLARGEYARQLRRYFDLFDRDQLLVLSADSLFREAEGTFQRIQDFLGLAAAKLPLEPRNVRSGYPPILPATRDRLREHYAPHNAELAHLLGEDFGW
jgi:Sulfotransferase domain